MNRIRMFSVLSVAFLVMTTSAFAQEGLTGSVSFVGMQVKFERDSLATLQGMDGMYFGAEGRLRWWRSSLGVRFLKGSLASLDGTQAENVTEMVITVGSQPTQWLTLMAGPHLRNYQTATGNLSSTLWEGQLHLENRLVGSSVRSYIDLWRTFASNEDFKTILGTGQGVEGGFVVMIPNIHLILQLGYRVDRSKIPDSVVQHTAESLFFTLGFGGR